MRVRKVLGYGVVTIVVLVAAAFLYIWIWRPFAPPAVVEPPQAGGMRITEGGMLADWYPSRAAGRHPTVVLLGGSEGGLRPGRTVAPLRAMGFNVLAVGYFRGPGQNQALEDIPLETFDRALTWLARQPQVDAERTAIMGFSKGAEAALIVASRHPEIRAVVAGMPSSVMWQGVSWDRGLGFGAGKGPSWSSSGRPLPYVPYGKMTWSEGPVSLYVDGLRTLPSVPDAIIPVERARAQILLVCGKDDFLWPSCPMARMVETRAKQRKGPPVTVLAYANAGHGVFGVPKAKGDPTMDTLGAMGGTSDGNNAARMDAWPKALAFLKERLQ